MAEVKKAEIIKDQQTGENSYVDYTIEHNGQEVHYHIPCTFSADDADLTLMSYLKSLENPATDVADWNLTPKEIRIESLQTRVDKIEAEREALRMQDPLYRANKERDNATDEPTDTAESKE